VRVPRNPPASSGATSVWESPRGSAGSPLARLDRTSPFPRTLSSSHPRFSSQVLTWAKRAPRVALATLSGARVSRRSPLSARRLKRGGAPSALRCAAAARGAGSARRTSSARGPTSWRRPRRGASGPETEGMEERSADGRASGRVSGRVLGGRKLTSPGRASAPQWPMPGTSAV
jgi:hypothetical protein